MCVLAIDYFDFCFAKITLHEVNCNLVSGHNASQMHKTHHILSFVFQVFSVLQFCLMQCTKGYLCVPVDMLIYRIEFVFLYDLILTN